MNVYEKIEEIIVNKLGKQASDFNENASLRKDLGLNSLELAQLAAMIEDEFDIVVDDVDIYQISTIKDTYDHICSALEEK